MIVPSTLKLQTIFGLGQRANMHSNVQRVDGSQANGGDMNEIVHLRRRIQCKIERKQI